MLNSEYKLLFAKQFLNDFHNIDPTDQKYQNLIDFRKDNSSSIEVSTITNTESILYDLNRYVEAYILLSKSSLDSIAREILDKIDLKIVDSKTGKIKNLIYINDLLNKQVESKNQKIFKIVKDFLDSADFNSYNKCRKKIAHEMLLNINCAFNKNEKIGSNSEYSIVRPILLPEILKDQFATQQKINNLDDWLENINKKINNFFEEIKKEIK